MNKTAEIFQCQAVKPNGCSRINEATLEQASNVDEARFAQAEKLTHAGTWLAASGTLVAG